MLQLLRDRRGLFLLLLVVASLFVLMAVQVKQDGPVGSEGLLMRLASPLLRVTAAVTGGVSELWDDYVSLRGTRRRIAALEEKLTKLMMELQELEEARVQNDRLQALLDLKEGMGTPSVAATVIGNNSRGLSHTLLVDRGSHSGIRPNMPVVGAQGVVGRVWTVARRISKIQLITDAEAGTGVLVQRTRVQGILLGEGSAVCRLEYISRLDDVAEKDLLVTSGLDGIYPKGLPVGTVAQVGQGAGILQRITVVPRVDFRRLEEVLILLRNDIRLPEPPPGPHASAPQASPHGQPSPPERR